MAEFRWYCLRAMSGKELKVKEVLDAEIANGDLGKYVQQVVVPTEKVVSQRGEKKVIKEKVLFSSYVFVRCLVVNPHGSEKVSGKRLAGEAQLRLSNTSNVVGFLCGRNSKMPEPLPDEQIEAMLGHVDVRTTEESVDEISFIVGETVKVNDGPFKDFDGVVEEVNAEKKKLKVMVKIFGRKTPLELNYDQVIKEA